MRYTVAQIKAINGDMKANAKRIIETINANKESDLIVFPAFSLSGPNVGAYTWTDRDSSTYVETLDFIRANIPGHMTVVVGSRLRNHNGGESVFIKLDHCETDMFDVRTYDYMTIKGVKVGVFTEQARSTMFRRAAKLNFFLSSYAFNQWESVAELEKSFLYQIDGMSLSPQNKSAVWCVNQIGGHDDLVYAGGSFMYFDGSVKRAVPKFVEHVQTFETEDDFSLVQSVKITGDRIAETYNAIVLGIRDYCRATGLNKIVLGASGGIDSALVLTMAADAIGGSNVLGVSMPSAYSSQHSQDDAKELMNNLGGEFRTVRINEMFDVFQRNLHLTNVAEENLQARIRGVIVMGIANQENRLVLEPSNKSENAVGYSTIYGDTVGGYAPLADVYKTDVYKLARYRNSLHDAPIPVSSIEKAPSAELKPNQFDTESLPDYTILDALLYDLIENGNDRNPAKLYGKYGKELVDFVFKKLLFSEWKRRQVAFGPKISSLALTDRKVPVAVKFDFSSDL